MPYRSPGKGFTPPPGNLPGGAALTGATDQRRTVARARGVPRRPGTSPLALRLPRLLTSAVP
ncbi:hypothetical protein [Raoultella planticola]|uniref:hypothetical protein n=1 Tax=Raoultella planticola TaxID=575 RepID=UPI002ACFA522|nr:hypothetical protein [Raoultella planticola]MDZ7446021.1 hypothetical protein [Raoultella planticola]